MDDSSLKEYLVTEFVEEYEDGNLSRTDLETRVRGILGSEDADRLLSGVPVNTVPAQRPTDGASATDHVASGLVERTVAIRVDDGGLAAYFVHPEGSAGLPGVVAVHENRGLVDHIKGCANRLAAAGYAVVAPDLLSRQGGTGSFASTNDAIAAIGQSDPDQNTDDLIAALDWLGDQPMVDNDRLAVTGWCMGGGYAWRVATRAGDRIKAAVPWYGPNPPSGVADIVAPVFAIYGELDQRINAGIEPITEQMHTNGKSFDVKIYPGAQHAFNNDSGERYNAEQAPIAWQDMLSFFTKHL